MSNGTRPRWRRPVSLLAWAAFLAGACFVLFLGTDEFSAQHTQGLLTPLLHWLFPDMNANEKYLLLSVKSAVARMVLTSLLLVAIVATLDETGQAYSSARTGSVYDVLLDLTGAAIALALVLWLRRLRARGAAPDPA
jgi:hypothetical protein